MGIFSAFKKPEEPKLAPGQPKTLEERYEGTILRTKAQLHGIRAHKRAESEVADMMLDVIRAADPNHPMGSRERYDARVNELRLQYLRDPDWIKKTIKSVRGQSYSLNPLIEKLEKENGTLALIEGAYTEDGRMKNPIA